MSYTEMPEVVGVTLNDIEDVIAKTVCKVALLTYWDQEMIKLSEQQLLRLFPLKEVLITCTVLIMQPMVDLQ